MKLTLITAAYNSAATLRDTFDSVLEQTYKDIEYILIDGGSRDETRSLIHEYEPLFGGRMRWISEPDKGLYNAMNKGIDMSTGEVIGLINSDDFLSAPDSVERQMAILEETQADAVYADVCYVDWNNVHRDIRYYSSVSFRRWKMRFGLMPAHPTFYCKRSVYEKYGNYRLDYKVAADFECLLRFLFIHRIRTVYNPMQVVTMRNGGVSSNGFESRKEIMLDHLRAFRENGVYTNPLFLSFRYFGKLWDLLKARFL